MDNQLPKRDKYGQVLCVDCKKNYHNMKYRRCLDCANDLYGGVAWKKHREVLHKVFKD